MNSIINKFSKLNRSERITALEKVLESDISDSLNLFLLDNDEMQSVFSEFSENYLSNFILPFGVVPNVLINGKMYRVPMVVEESSVIAAASKAAGFWAKHGGFCTQIIGTTKKGQVHFIWHEKPQDLTALFQKLKPKLIDDCKLITKKMEERGGGITDIQLLNLTQKLNGYFQLDVSFETVDAMGANFINTCLEQIAASLLYFVNENFTETSIEIIMSILSNYTPECAVECSITCPIDELSTYSSTFTPNEFANRFNTALEIAHIDVNRAATHNKGIYNGVDAVILATGNDWRAVEAAGHAYASKNGHYASLSKVDISNNQFTYTLTIPLAIGTVGGLTQTHPLSKLALEMLQQPSAKELMSIAAAIGLANNFSAVASLVTTGIQKGHMKLHLANILNQLDATERQKKQAAEYFSDKTISYHTVEEFLKLTS